MTLNQHVNHFRFTLKVGDIENLRASYCCVINYSFRYMIAIKNYFFLIVFNFNYEVQTEEHYHGRLYDY